MRKRFHTAALGWAVLLGGSAFFASSHQALGDRSSDGVLPREVVLSNGLKILMVERHEQPTVAAGVFYKVGAVDDPRGKSGIAHMFEHMLFKGSKIIGTSDYASEREIIVKQDELREKMISEMNKMRLMKRRGEITDVLDPSQWTSAYREYSKVYDELVAAARVFVKNNEFGNLYTTNGGARLNAGTMHDATLYFVQLPSNKIELFFWLESDRMAGGIMREFYIERKNVREERRLRVESTPTGKYDEAFEALFWQSHPYGVPVIGWPSEVESITRDDVRAFYKIYYAPNNATMVLIGDFDTDSMIELAEKYFGRIPHGQTVPPPMITEESEPIAVRRLHAEAETNPRVRVRYHGVAMAHTDEAALDVLGGLLSGKAGRLYKRLVTEEDVAMGQPLAGHEGRKYAGHFEINVTVKEGRDPEDVERMILEELDKLREGEISDRELQRVKNQVLAASIQQVRSNFGLMFRLGLFETWHDWRYINESPERMLAVSRDDLRRVLGHYFDPNTRSVAIYRTAAPKPDSVLVLDTPSVVDDPALEGVADYKNDPRYKDLIARLPKKWQSHLNRRMVHLLKQTDPERIERIARTLAGGLSSQSFTEDQREMFQYVIDRMEERARNMRYEKWIKPEVKSDKESD